MHTCAIWRHGCVGKKSSGRHKVGDKLKYLESQAGGINDHKDLGVGGL